MFMFEEVLMAKGKNTVAVVEKLAAPVAAEYGVNIWDVRFEKEGSMWYLRIIIDKEGGVDINDCEKVSRKLDKLLDEADPIDQSYCLEVSSPGVERELVKKEHFDAFMGQEVTVRFIRPVDGERDFVGVLSSFDDGKVTVMLDENEEMVFDLSETSFVRVVDKYEYGGQTENE